VRLLFKEFTNYTNLDTIEEEDIVYNSISLSAMVGIEEFPIDNAIFVIKEPSSRMFTRGSWCVIEGTIGATEYFALLFYVYNIQPESVGFLKLELRSCIGLLEDVTLDEIMYEDTSLKSIMQDTVAAANVGGATAVYIDPQAPFPIDPDTHQELKITGYFPEQTARQRLQWLCLMSNKTVEFGRNYGVRITTGANVYNTYPKIVYFNPVVVQNRNARNYSVLFYEYDERTPATGEDSITVNGHVYVVTKGEVAYPAQYDYAGNNTAYLDIPSINENLAYMNFLSFDNIFYDENSTITASVFCKSKVPMPGDHVCIMPFKGKETLQDIYVGRANHVEYEFGKGGVKATVTIPYALSYGDLYSDTTVNLLTINRKYGNMVLENEKRPYVKITGTTQTEHIINENIETFADDVITIYVASTYDYVYTVGSGNTTLNLAYYRAFQQDLETGTLFLERVDDYSLTGGVMSIE